MHIEAPYWLVYWEGNGVLESAFFKRKELLKTLKNRFRN